MRCGCQVNFPTAKHTRRTKSENLARAILRVDNEESIPIRTLSRGSELPGTSSTILLERAVARNLESLAGKILEVTTKKVRFGDTEVRKFEIDEGIHGYFFSESGQALKGGT